MPLILPFALIVRLLLLPDMPDFEVGRFSTMQECKAASDKLDRSTPVLLVLRCETDT